MSEEVIRSGIQAALRVQSLSALSDVQLEEFGKLWSDEASKRLAGKVYTLKDLEYLREYTAICEAVEQHDIVVGNLSEDDINDQATWWTRDPQEQERRKQELLALHQDTGMKRLDALNAKYPDINPAIRKTDLIGSHLVNEEGWMVSAVC